MLQWIDANMTASDTMYIVLAVLSLTLLWSLWRLNCDQKSPISLVDLVSIDGRLNERKFTRFGAWIVSTWGFVYLLVSTPSTFPEWYFTAYMGAWVANALLGKMIKEPTDGDKES